MWIPAPDWKKIAHWADELSTDVFWEMVSIVCKCRSLKKNIYIGWCILENSCVELFSPIFINVANRSDNIMLIEITCALIFTRYRYSSLKERKTN